MLIANDGEGAAFPKAIRVQTVDTESVEIVRLCASRWEMQRPYGIFIVSGWNRKVR